MQIWQTFNLENKDELIKAHQRIKLTEIDVVRRLQLTYSDCIDEVRIRQFCATNKKTLPDMIEIEATEYPPESELKQWHVVVYEQPKLRDGA